MKKRIFHKVLIPALVVMLMTPFCFTTVKADATNQDILDMLTSIRSQIVYILQTQRIGSTGNYDTIDYLQKMDTNLLELDTHLTEIMADMTAAWDPNDPLQNENYFKSIMNYFSNFYEWMGSNNSRLSAINSNLSSMHQTLQSILQDFVILNNYVNQLVQGVISLDTNFSTFLTLFRNIDNTLDTISWTDGNSNTLVGLSNSLNGTYSIPSETTLYRDLYIQINFTSSINRLYKIILPVSYNYDRNKAIQDDNIKIYSKIGSNYYESRGITYFYSYQTGNLVLYLNVINNSYPFVINITNNSGGIEFYSTPSTISAYSLKYIDDTDIEYWQLLNYFTTYNGWKQQLIDNQNIIELLQNGTSTSSSTADSNNNMNQQLQTSVTQYDQIENQFKESFSTSMNQISRPDLSNIVSAASWYTTQLTSLFNASGSFQIIYVLPLVLGIALFFIGRGGVVFRQSSNQETKWVETIKDENGFTTRHGTIRSETTRGKGRYK